MLFTALLAGAAAPVAAQEVTRFLLLKEQQFSQTSASAPVAAAGKPFILSASVRPLLPDRVKNPTVAAPAGAPQAMGLSPDDEFVFFASFETLAELNAAYPAGNYALHYVGQLFGETNHVVALGAGSFPPAPQVSNYAEAQAINADADFTLRWAPVAGAGANDFVVVLVRDGQGAEAFSSPAVGDPGALAGATPSIVLPANTLDAGKTYMATVSFYHLTPNNSVLPQILAGFASETGLTLQATGGSSGGDTTPPTLEFTFPTNNATGVTLSMFVPIMFAFSEPMAPTHALRWSANVALDKLNYSWSNDKTTLLCNYLGTLPGGAAVTWALNPTADDPNNFRDAAGNLLPVGVYAGQFTLAGQGGTNNPCQPTNNVLVAGFALQKGILFIQTNATTLLPDPESPATFYATVTATNATTGSGSITVPLPSPAQRVLTFQSIFGTLLTGFLFDTLTNEAALEAAYPSGNYKVEVVLNGVTSQTQAALPAYPLPEPRLLNFDAAQAVDASADFTLTWTPFASAAAGDKTSLSITETNQTVFSAPDPCVPRELAANAGSVVIPKGTFQPGRTYVGNLCFGHVVTTNLLLQPNGMKGMVSYTKATTFLLKTTGGTPPTSIRLDALSLGAAGDVTLKVTGNLGRPLIIESTPDFSGWLPAYSTNLSTNPLILTFRPPASRARFFRAQQN